MFTDEKQMFPLMPGQKTIPRQVYCQSLSRKGQTGDYPQRAEALKSSPYTFAPPLFPCCQAYFSSSFTFSEKAIDVYFLAVSALSCCET